MISIRSMKFWICLACVSCALSAPYGPTPLRMDIIDMAAISRMSPQQLEMLAEGLAMEEIMRTKRSSAQALSSVVSKASSGLQSKVGLLGQASAFISSASSKSHTEDHGYSYEPESSKVDFWGLKKSILYTLFQAVKAITGGVTILKGQLIKGGGALATTLGKVIAVKGDAVSNIGKKIVNSAALSQKKPVYGPPPSEHAHVEYAPPTSYGAPTAPAYHHTAPAAPTGYAAHKYPAQLDGRGKVQAGLVFLTPLDAGTPDETLQTAHSGYTPLEPPPSIIHTVYSAIKNAFSSVAPAITGQEYVEPASAYQPPPLQPMPPFKPMSWGAVNSYGEPAAVDAYQNYDPINPHPPFDYAANKNSVVPTKKHYQPSRGLTSEKVQKINANLGKLASYMANQRSSEDLPQFNTQIGEMLKNGIIQYPTQVVSDNEVGVYPADFHPEPDRTLSSSTTTTTTTTSTSSTTTTTAKPKTSDTTRKKKELSYFLRGNTIIQV